MKKILPIIIALTIIGAGTFYGGVLYGKNKNSNGGQNNFANFQNLSPEERQARFQQPGNAATRQGGNRQGGANFTQGEIISKDDKSITIKLRDGGSKIAFFSNSTEVGKFSTTTPDNLLVGESVSVNGTANQDGSITAQSIQIRPQMPNRPIGQGQGAQK